MVSFHSGFCSCKGLQLSAVSLPDWVFLVLSRFHIFVKEKTFLRFQFLELGVVGI